MKPPNFNDKSVSKPFKVLLHLAKVGDDWAGKATCYGADTEFKFSSLKDLSDMLNMTVGEKESINYRNREDPAID